MTISKQRNNMEKNYETPQFEFVPLDDDSKNVFFSTSGVTLSTVQCVDGSW